MAKGKNNKYAQPIRLPSGDPTPEYFEEFGLRKVQPYEFSFSSYAKERWQGRTLIDVYSKEFRDRSTEYYVWAIETGMVLLNNEPTTPNVVLKNGDLLSNVLHRHEPPVVAGPVKILYDGRLPGNDGKTLVVEKPGSMPVHATGRYNFNTLLSILKYDYDLPLVHTANRLDRLTSGVMVCSLTVEHSKSLGGWFGGERIADGGVKKEYVARCLGKFPDGEIICSEPLLTIDRQLGVNVVHPDGRPSKTIFKRMSYHAASNTSALHCRPITGRSHQIRVHLQFLGFPIANDPVYQNSDAWGESGGKGGIFSSTSPEDQLAQEEQKEERRKMAEQALDLEMHRIAHRREKIMKREAHKARKKVDQDGPGRVEFKQKERKEKRERNEAILREENGDSPPEPTVATTLESSKEESDIPNSSNPHWTRPASPERKSKPVVLDPNTTTIFNRNGHVKKELFTPSEEFIPSAANDDRLEYELPLSAQAHTAIIALRSVKDSEDGWSRWRDMKGVEKAKAANKTSYTSATPKSVDEITASTPTRLVGPPSNVLDEESDDAFCSICYVPLIKDPIPEKLFIYLHALRYTTTEWDYSSEIPYWALESWNPEEEKF